jgi:Mg-chelatase subunit ChlD
MRNRRRLGVAVLLVALLAALSAAAPTPRAHAQAATVEVVGLNAEPDQPPQVVATVLDENGALAPDLTADDFDVAINGNPVPITDVTRAVDSTKGIAVVLAIDVSGSMEGAPLDQAKAAAQRFVDGLEPDDQIAIITFSETSQKLLDFTSDRTAITAAIAGLRAGGPTALYNATADSARLASTAASARRAVILLSDGGIGVSTSTITRDEALDTVTPLGVPVFTIGLGAEIDRAYLEELSSISGGQLTEAPSPEALTEAYDHVGEVLRGQFVITLDDGLTLAADEPATVRVSVDASGLVASGERTFAPAEPAIQITGLPEGGRITSPTTLTAQVFAPTPVMNVKFFINDELVSESSKPPYEYVVDPAELSGTQALRVEAEIAFGEPIVEESSLQVGAPAGLLSGPIVPVVAVVAVAVLLLAFLLWRRRKKGSHRPGPEAARVLPSMPVRFERSERELRAPAPPLEGPASAPAALDESGGWLVAFAGPISGKRFPVSGKPVSIGSSSRCAVQLPERSSTGEEVPSELARAWVREGQLMVHFLLRLTATGPVGGGWSILGHGESFTIGPCALRFEQANAPAVSSEPQEAAPRERSALEPIDPSDVEPLGPPPGIAAEEPPAAPEPDLAPGEPSPAFERIGLFDRPAGESGPEAPEEPHEIPNIFKDRPTEEPREIPNIFKDRPGDPPPADRAAGDPGTPPAGDFGVITPVPPPQDDAAEPPAKPVPLDADEPAPEAGPWDEPPEERQAV